MAKNDFKYLLSYKELLDTFQNKPVPNNILLSIKEKVLVDEIVRTIYWQFTGDKTVSGKNIISFNAEDKLTESVINECSNTGLFTEKKVVVLRNVKKLLKDAKLALLNYLNNANPDTCLIMTASDEEFAPDKIFLYDPKSDSETAGQNRKIVEKSVSMFQLTEFTENELTGWIEEKFEGYKISKETIKYFLRFTNYSLDEILSEIEKLKTYSFFTKEITSDDVNICNGIAKDFKESDFIKAIMERKVDEALKIYLRISLRKEVEVYLVFLLTSAFITIYKLFDPAVLKLQGWQLKKELKLWFEDQEKLLPDYKQYRDSIDTKKIATAFEYIYNTDKKLKTSGGDKENAMTELINNICSL